MKYVVYIGWSSLVIAHIALSCLVIMLTSEFAVIAGGFFPWAANICIGAMVVESFARLVMAGIKHINKVSYLF